MKKVYVALITPFLENNSIDYAGLDEVMKDLINDGVHGFIVCGTTAESPTLSEDEKFSLLQHVIHFTQNRVEIYFGCGNNNTLDTLRLCKKACNYAIEGLLLVTPYYNKPSQEGLYQHYACIAKNVRLPIMLYQVESRCQCVFSISTLQRLQKDCPNIFALKYASKDMEMAKQIHRCLPTLKLFCGDDDRIKESTQVGMDGVVSVIAHIALKEILQFYQQEDYELDFYFKRLSFLLFLESSPAGIKYVLAKKYRISDRLRLPLVPYNTQNKQLLDAYFDKKFSK
ncbi:MAG: 4-hydroxy-tetrahydrodipicolinate synthase [Erysipelotrichia bacterium]|nr:4-hydroxy-tetrahydrodipicolinate synthase [Erysipelotrichia bacterium]NCC54489.1 4-hydroxy-tetrahydrodipicolinate synthase [Erysipelotrichia bacterium]